MCVAVLNDAAAAPWAAEIGSAAICHLHLRAAAFAVVAAAVKLVPVCCKSLWQLAGPEDES